MAYTESMNKATLNIINVIQKTSVLFFFGRQKYFETNNVYMQAFLTDILFHVLRTNVGYCQLIFK